MLPSRFLRQINFMGDECRSRSLDRYGTASFPPRPQISFSFDGSFGGAEIRHACARHGLEGSPLVVAATDPAGFRVSSPTCFSNSSRLALFRWLKDGSPVRSAVADLRISECLRTVLYTVLLTPIAVAPIVNDRRGKHRDRSRPDLDLGASASWVERAIPRSRNRGACNA